MPFPAGWPLVYIAQEFTETVQRMWAHVLIGVATVDHRSMTDPPPWPYIWKRMRPSPSGASQTP
jgi:hypothetical protein